MKNKKYVFILIFVLLCVLIYVLFVRSTIEMCTWSLTIAQQTEAPYFVVAHKAGDSYHDDRSNLFKFSKEVELTLTAKDGILTITDKTNGKTYNGSYTLSSPGNKYVNQSYKIIIDGKEGYATFNSSWDSTMFITLDGYLLHFEAQPLDRFLLQ